MPEATAGMVGYERRNPRALILLVCFAWGLILGFVVYIETPSFAQNQVKQEEIDKKEDEKLKNEQKNNVPEIAKVPVINRMSKSPFPGNEIDIPVNSVPTPPIDDDDEKKIVNIRAVPDTAPVAVNFSAGLNGSTTYRPLKPVKVEKPAPKVDFKAKPAGSAPKKAVTINEVDPPELDE